MTKKRCPLGEDCDLTTAWMAGRNYTIHRYREETNPIIEAKDAEIERLRSDLAKTVEALRMIENIELTFLDECRDIARTTLAELTGGKDA